MPRFFVPGENIEQNSVKITGDDAWHIARSLRMAVGEAITVCDGGAVYECTLEKITDDEVIAHVCSSGSAESESPVSVTLYQALPKGDKMDTIVQKAVEMGAVRIVPFLSERCISRPDAKTAEKKCVRWQRIALEAAKQCGRGVVPTVEPLVTFEKMLDGAKKASLACFCYEGDGTRSIKEIFDKSENVTDIAVIVGSEGGFSKKEADTASESGICMAGLGKRILRCESAPSFALACIAYKYEL